MTRKLSKMIVIAIIVLAVMFIASTKVSAYVDVDLNYYSVNGIFEKGEVVDLRFVDHVEGATYRIHSSSSDEFPEGLSLSNDGRIVGTVSQNQSNDEYLCEIDILMDGETIGGFQIQILISDNIEAEEWVNFNNLFMEEEILEDQYYTKDGFIVYNQTIADYISYNSLTKTYNITLTQDFSNNNAGNYVEMIFKESEYDKFIKFEMLENVGFYKFSPYILEIADYRYVRDNGDNLYSAYIYADVDHSYTGANRHLKVKASNPNNGQYRILNFTITDSNSLYVAFETNGGSYINSLQKEIGDKITLPDNPTKEGWIFEGWYTDETLNTPFDTNTELLNNLVLYAKWTNDYKFVEGGSQTCFLDKDENVKFRINASLDLLDKVLVDGAEIDSSKYLKESGGTIITLLKDYVKTLTVGEHTLKVTYLDGKSAETTFSVKQSAETDEKDEKDETPKTGIGSNTIIAGVIGTIASCGMVVLTKKEN
ncbi:MAG: InlB B-repeat-containing protein [Clostridia bacterium]|nr:InlB B-repeat-containing protein [Clostridia bacterium]